MILLIAEIEDILLGVYEMSMGFEMMIFIKMMLTLANVEAGKSISRRKTGDIELIWKITNQIKPLLFRDFLCSS